MAKLNFIESQHPRMLSYVACRSEATEEQPWTLVDWLGEVAEIAAIVFMALCALIGFAVLVLLMMAA